MCRGMNNCSMYVFIMKCFPGISLKYYQIYIYLMPRVILQIRRRSLSPTTGCMQQYLPAIRYRSCSAYHGHEIKVMHCFLVICNNITFVTGFVIVRTVISNPRRVYSSNENQVTWGIFFALYHAKAVHNKGVLIYFEFSLVGYRLNYNFMEN